MGLTFVQCGYAEAFDYCQLMIIKLNSKQWIAKQYSFPGKETEDVVRAEKIAEIYPQVDRRLKIFFDCEYKNASFMSHYLYEIMCNKMVHTLEDFRNVIQEDTSFKAKLIRYYLNEDYSTDQEMMFLMMTGAKTLDGSYKEMLMYFLVFEQEYMKLLLDSMIEVEEKLKELYKQKLKKLHQLEKCFDFEIITDRRRKFKKWAKELKRVEISFSYCNQYVVMNGENQDECSWMILGCEYLEAIENKWSVEIPFEKIGNALGDELRIRILIEIQKYGEISVPQLAKLLHLPSSAVFYHLDVLKKACILCSRMEGRTAYFWLDQRTFKYAIEELKKLGGI